MFHHQPTVKVTMLGRRAKYTRQILGIYFCKMLFLTPRKILVKILQIPFILVQKQNFG